MAQGVSARIVGLAGADPLFARIRQEAEEAIRREPELALFLTVNVLNHETLEAAVSHRVASRLDHRDLPAALVRQTFAEAIARDATIGEAFRELETNIESVGITAALNNEPDSANLTVRGIRPLEGQPVRITHGDDVYFGGVVKRVLQSYLVLNRRNVVYHVTCDDYTWLFDKKLVSAKYTAPSATRAEQ